jgi:hypothetical protein
MRKRWCDPAAEGYSNLLHNFADIELLVNPRRKSPAKRVERLAKKHLHTLGLLKQLMQNEAGGSGNQEDHKCHHKNRRWQLWDSR